MHPGGRIATVVVAAALGLAACGGTDWNATNTDSVKVDPASAKRAAAARAVAAARAERPYVDAMVASALANDDADGFDRCVASAIVHGYGVAVFNAKKLTPAVLRRPDSTLDALPAPTAEQADEIGTALQYCGILGDLSKGVAAEVGITDVPTTVCLSQHLATAPARRFVALSVLGKDLDLAAAHDMVGIVATCTDLATLILKSTNGTIDPTTRSCMVNALRGNAPVLKDYFALVISHGDTESEQQDFGTITVALNRCRPSARTGFTASG
ncbi:MAG TPA: hypothetical protein VL119_08155 [Acidimicrobiia bacterium]|nr:hypothetical protein [Acidimicrobiia bacterium]